MSPDHVTVLDDRSVEARRLSAENVSVGAAIASQAYFRAAAATLASLPTPFAPERSVDLLKRHYGLIGSVAPLSSEIEHTSQVGLPDGRRLILKTAAGPEAAESFRFQATVIAGLEGASGFVAPRIVRTSTGDSMFQDGDVCGYLQTRIEGVPLRDARMEPGCLYRTGRALAELNRALAAIDAPAAHRPVLWHLSCWPRLMEFETYLPAGPIADLVCAEMRRYSEVVAPQLPQVEWQVTHNDLSPFNMFAVGSETAFIDFGDGGWSPRLQDLAIAASHFVRDPDTALGGAEHLVAGYASAIPLSQAETKLLVGLMRARQSALILINHWRAHLFPGEAAYIKKNVALAERGLSLLAPLCDAQAEAAVVAAACSGRRQEAGGLPRRD